MGMTSTAILFFGVIFPEGYNFPWSNEEIDLDIEDWWIFKVKGFEPSVEIYGEDGDYLPGKKPSEAVIDAYYAERHEFSKAHPLPVEIEYAGADGCDFTIVAQWTQCKAWDGDAIEIPEPRDHKALTTFLEEFCKATDEYDEQPSFDPSLRLATYYG